MLVTGHPKTLHHPNGYEIVTVQDDAEEGQLRARMSGRPEPVIRRKGRTPMLETNNGGTQHVSEYDAGTVASSGCGSCLT